MMKYVAILLFVLAACAFANDDEETPRPKSACEEDRERRLNAITPGPLHLVPECEENGDYAAKQCYNDPKGWCVCYRRNGGNINSASKSIKECDCVRERDEQIQNKEANPVECLPTGEYKNKL